jgi:hypothetical protein
VYRYPHPASHGCVRVPLYIISKVERLTQVGEPVYIS